MSNDLIPSTSDISPGSEPAHHHSSAPAYQQRKLEGVQALRFFAAAAVLLFHIGGYLERHDNGDFNYFSFGARGVEVFFVISGFIITHAYRPGSSAVEFISRRLARVVPIYWLLTIAIASVSLIHPSLLFSTTFSLEGFWKSLLFIPYARSDGAIVPMLFLGWSLNYEMFFYAMFAASLAMVQKPYWAVCACIFALVGCHAVYSGQEIIFRFYTNPLLLQFATGIGLARIYRAHPTAFEARFAPLFFVGFLVAVGMQAALNNSSLVMQNVSTFLLVSSALCFEQLASRVGRILVTFGDASYSLYLVHPYVINVVGSSGNALGVYEPTLSSGMMIVGSIATSVLLFRWFEKPVQKWLLRLL